MSTLVNVEEILRRIREDIEPGHNYISVELRSGSTINFTDKGVFGKPANLIVIAAEEDSEIQINHGSPIPLKRDEAIVMINALQISNIEVLSGTVKVFATIVPKWMPAMFWTRSVTVIGVADAVQDALEAYGAAKDSTLSSPLPRYIVDSSGNELSDYLRYLWRPEALVPDITIPSGALYNVAGNMVKSYNNLTVEGTLIVSDQALVRTWGTVEVTGKVIIQDSAQVVSEVVA